MGSHVIIHHPGSSTTFLKLSLEIHWYPFTPLGGWREALWKKNVPPPHSHSWVGRGIVKVKCFPFDDTVIPIRTKTLIFWYGIHCINHQATKTHTNYVLYQKKNLSQGKQINYFRFSLFWLFYGVHICEAEFWSNNPTSFRHTSKKKPYQ